MESDRRQEPEPRVARQDPRRETLAQRDDRNLVELIQELRVVGLGVQVIFGFLLSLPFTVRFSLLSRGQRDLYVASITLATVATVLLLGPVAYHRMVFRAGMKEPLVRFANAMAILGLVAVGGTILTAVLLVVGYVAGALTGALITGLAGVMLCCLWFALPLSRRAARRPRSLASRPPLQLAGGLLGDVLEALDPGLDPGGRGRARQAGHPDRDRRVARGGHHGHDRGDVVTPARVEVGIVELGQSGGHLS